MAAVHCSIYRGSGNWEANRSFDNHCCLSRSLLTCCRVCCHNSHIGNISYSFNNVFAVDLVSHNHGSSIFQASLPRISLCDYTLQKIAIFNMSFTCANMSLKCEKWQLFKQTEQIFSTHRFVKTSCHHCQWCNCLSSGAF